MPSAEPPAASESGVDLLTPARSWRIAIVLAAVGAAWWLIALSSGSATAFAMAIVIAAGSALAMAYASPPERRLLAGVLAISAPVIGPLLAAWAASSRGRGGDELIHDPHATIARMDGTELARRLTRALPSCEALVSKDVDLRRATLARLARRAGKEDLALLRWAKTRNDPELAVEIALAFEEIGARFERSLREARMAAATSPSFDAHVELFAVISDAMRTGIVDAPLVAKLASEARVHHEAALALAPARAHELLAARAQFELSVGRPELVIAMLDESVAGPLDPQLRALYTEAAYATRAFGLVASLSTRQAA